MTRRSARFRILAAALNHAHRRAANTPQTLGSEPPPLVAIAPDAAHRTCDASTLGLFDRPVGPCVLRHGHDGPVHQDANGTQWWPITAPASSGESHDVI